MMRTCGDCTCWSNDHNMWCSNYEMYTLGSDMICTQENIKKCKEVPDVDIEELLLALHQILPQLDISDALKKVKDNE